MTERKLASIQQIKHIEPIPNADNIVKLSINGWSVVSKKNEFKIGDFCVYFEIDSFLPITDQRFSFLEKSSKAKMDDEIGLRLRTIKLKNQISQGLALPLSLFDEVSDLKIGDDVTNILNIKKYGLLISKDMHHLKKSKHFLNY